MKFGGRFKRIEPKYVGDKSNNGIWSLNETYALREAGLWPKSNNSSLDIFFESNKLILSSITSNISDISTLSVPLTVVKFQKEITDGPSGTPINAIYNDDYSNSNNSYAYILSGSNSELIIGDQDYTLECWVKPIKRHPNGYYTLFSTYINGNDGAVFGFDNDGRIFADGGLGNWAFGNITNGINVSSGQWYHIAFCRSGGILKCFVNGSQYGSNANSGKNHSSSTIRIGNHSNQSFIGHMTEVRFSVGVARYTSAFSAPTVPLPTIEQEIAPLSPVLLDPLYGDSSVELFWKNSFNGGSDITSFDIDYAVASDMSGASTVNIPISTFVGGVDDYWNSVSLLLKVDGDAGSMQFVDLSKTPKTVTAYGSAQVSSTKIKFGTGSLSLPSAGTSENTDRLEIASDPAFNFGTDDFTIEAWVYFEGFSNEEAIVSKSNNSGGSYRLVCHGSSRNLAFYAESQNVVSANNVFTTGQWYHVAACRSSGTLRLFIDGTEVASGSMTTNLSNSVPLTIGNYAVFGSYSSGYEATLDGFIDEIRITNAARYVSSFTVPSAPYPYYTALPTSYNVTGLTNDTPYYFRLRANNIIGNGSYSSTIGPVTPSASLPQRLIGGDFGLSDGADPYEYYVTLLLHLDGDNESSIITDSSASPKNLSVNGTSLISTTQHKWGGSSLSFGSNGSIRSASNEAYRFDTGDFVVEMWVFFENVNQAKNIIDFRNSAAGTPWVWNIDSNGRIGTYFAVGSDLRASSSLVNNQWHHIALSRTNGVVRQYIDGVLDGQITMTGNLSGSTLWIGENAGGGGTWGGGYIDDLRITKGSSRGYTTSTITVPTAAFPDPSPAPQYIGVSYKQDNYWYATSQAAKIFDNNLTDNNENQWKSTSLNSAFGVDFGTAQTVLRYKMWRNTGNQNSPTNWVLQGSNTQSDWDTLQNYNGSTTYGNWQTIDTRNNIYLPKVSSSSPGSNPFGLFVVNSPASYRYYRLFVSGARADGPGTEASRAWIAEMQFLATIGNPSAPSNFAAYPADQSASLSWSVVGPAITGYVVEWSSDGGDTVLGTANTSSQAYTVTGLTNGNSYVFRVKSLNTVGESTFTSWSDPVTPVVGHSPIQDNVFRFRIDDQSTAAHVYLWTTTGYAKLSSSTGEVSSVVGNGLSPWGNYWQWSQFFASITGLSIGTERMISIISCDASGNPSGEIEFVDFSYAPPSGGVQRINLIDMSGCASLKGCLAVSSTAGIGVGGFMGPPQATNLPSTITEVRAVGVGQSFSNSFNNTNPAAWNGYVSGFTYGGLGIAGQQLSAAALNQIYSDLATRIGTGSIVVHNNPGVAADDPTIATAKGYTVYGS